MKSDKDMTNAELHAKHPTWPLDAHGRPYDPQTHSPTKAEIASSAPDLSGYPENSEGARSVTGEDNTARQARTAKEVKDYENAHKVEQTAKEQTGKD